MDEYLAVTYGNNHLIRLFMVAIFVTCIGRHVFYYLVEEAWFVAPDFEDWFFLEAFALATDNDIGAPPQDVLSSMPWDATEESPDEEEQQHEHQE